MSKEDVKETNPESKITFENTVTKPRPQSGPVPKGVDMKENSDPPRHESDSGKRSSPLGTATPKPKDSNTTISSSYSYLNNPKVNFGSEVPHTLNSDANRLNAPRSVTTTNINDSNSMLERIAFPYKLLRKYIASLPEAIYGNGTTAEHLNGKRDVGTLVQSISLILNGENIAEENDSSLLKNLMEVPTRIEPLKVSNGTEPLPRSVSRECGKQAIEDVGVHKVDPILVEMLYPQVPANGKKTKELEKTASSELKINFDTSENNSISPSGTCLTASSKATNLFKVISRHVMSITSPGQSFDGNHTPLPKFQNQTSPMFTDSMFLRGRRISDGSMTLVDDSLTQSNVQQLENGLSSDFTSLDRNLSKQNNADQTAVRKLENVTNDLMLGKDTKTITVLEMPNQVSLHNIFNEQYLSGKKKHSFNSNTLRAQISDSSTSINYHKTSDNEEQEVTEKSGSGISSDLSSFFTNDRKQTNAHLASKSSVDGLKNVKTEPALVEDTENVTTMDLPTQLSLHNLFDEDYLSGRKKHSFSCAASKRHTSDDTTINSLTSSDESMQDIPSKSDHGRKGEGLSVLELRSLMSEHGLLEEKNVNGNAKTKTKSSESIRINFDDSVRNVTSKYGHGQKWESSSVKELRSLMSKHGLLEDKNLNGKLDTKAQPSESIRINFDDSIECVTNKVPTREFKLKSPSFRDLHSDMSVHGILDDKNTPEEKTQPQFESSNKHNNISFKESTPTIVLFREESFVPHYKKPMQNKKETSDRKGDTFDVTIKQRDDSITIEIIEPTSSDSYMPLLSTLEQDTSSEMQRQYTEGEIDATSMNENNPYISFGSDKLHKTISNYLNDEVDRDSSEGDKNIKDNRTAVDEKLLCQTRKSSRNLQSMLNTEILQMPDLNLRELPIAVYQSISESNDIAYETSADSIDDSESRFQRVQSQKYRQPTEAMPGRSGPLEEDASQQTPSESLESSEEATPENSMDESGSGTEDSQISDSLANWSTIPAASLESTGTDNDETMAGDALDDEFDSTFKFSQLQFPTDGHDSEWSETSEASLGPASEITEPSVDEGTLDSSIIEDAGLMKFLTTGSVKSSDIDEKLSEAHGHSKNSFNKYENSNEQKLNLGTKSSGQMPRPHEMLSIYSRGESEPPRALTAKSSSSSNIKIKPALRMNEDGTSPTGARPMPSKSVGRSVSFSEKRKEFPWRSTDVLSTPMAVTPVQVETDSPLVASLQKDNDRGGQEEESTSPEVPEKRDDKISDATENATDDVDKEDADVRSGDGADNEPKKSASKDVAGKQQAAARRRSSSMNGSGKRAKSKQKMDEEPKRSNSSDENQTSVFSLDNILPYMRLFFTPVLDEVALDTLHVLRGDPGCELCPQRRQEDEEQARVVPRQEGGESGDDEISRDNDEKDEEQQDKEEDERRQSDNNEEERNEHDDMRKSSHQEDEENNTKPDEEEKEEGGKDERRQSGDEDHEAKKEVEDVKNHHEHEENKKPVEEEKEEGGEDKGQQSSDTDHEGKKGVEEVEENKKKQVEETERVQEESEEK